MGKGFHHVTDVERRLVQSMKAEGLSWPQMRRITGRSYDTLRSIFDSKPNVKKDTRKGAPRKVPDKVFVKIEKRMAKLQKQHHPKGAEVTARMISAAAGVHISDRTLRRALHERGYHFYKLKERQILQPEDYPERADWCRRRKSRPASAWHSMPHAIIDNKHFQIFITGAGRKHAARRAVQGAYQPRGHLPAPHMVKPKGGSIRYPAPGVTVTAAVIKGKIRVWHYIQGPWNGDRAAAMYKGPLLQALRRAFPAHARSRRQRWVVLEDNDPAGYKSAKARWAKTEAGIVTDDLPRRSPDLNVLDYALWSAINRRMRKQEFSWPHNKKETSEQYKERLRKTALALPEPLVRRCVADMRRRCREVCKASGGLFVE